MRPGRSDSPRKVVVIGAGITGLTAARELARGRAEVIVLEAAPRIGGKVRTENVDGVTVETGPDSFVTLKPEMLELVKELGLQDELVCTAPDPTVCIFKEGRLVPLPAGMNLVSPTKLPPFAFSTLFSMQGKLRMALEPLIPVGKGLEDESLADFARRRLGAEALDVLVGPLLAGIYAGDPEKM
ncbi:MAG: protoporphyrinogen oxidase, partial [Elusimicrobiota bacterium]